MPAGCPELTVEGVGKLALPLSDGTAAALSAVAEQAPFGRGLDTVVDTKVRNALQVDASKVATDASWLHILQSTILPAAAEGLGLMGTPAGSITAELYKLLLYETGGHFAAHRDTEKAPGMFATLVVQLPCFGGHEGGRLVVRHGEREHLVDTAQPSACDLQFTAFFADCEHELLPVTAGRRLVLAYNLCWAGQGSVPHAPDDHQAAELAAAVEAWEQELAAGGSQMRLALQLEHQYTSANLSFAHLKGTDRRLADILLSCPLLEVRMALVTRITRGGTGSPVYSRAEQRKRMRYYLLGEVSDDLIDDMGEPIDPEEFYGPWDSGGGGHRMKWVDTDEIEMEWVAPDGSCTSYKPLCLTSEYFHPQGAKLFGKPDAENYERYTGNTGPTLEYIYRRAVLVMWPRSSSLAVACAAGVDTVLDVLQAHVTGLFNGSTSNSSTARTEAQQTMEAAMSCLENPPQPANPYRHWGMARGTFTSSTLAYALQLLAAAHSIGVPECERAAVRLLAVLNTRQGLPSNGVPTALGELLAALNSAALNSAVLQLVHKWGAAQVQPCTELVLVLTSMPELQQQLALAVGESLQAATAASATPQPSLDPSARFVTSRAKSMPQMESWQLLLAAVQARPALKGQLALAAAETLLSSDTAFAQQQPASIVQLSDLLLSSPGLQASHYGRFAAALQKRPDSQQLLPHLLQSAAVQCQPAAYQQLVLAAAEWLLSSDTVFAQQQPAAVFQLSHLLLTTPGLAASHYGRFAAAFQKRADSQVLLPQLLQSAAVQSRPAVEKQLVEAAADWLLSSETVPFAQQPVAALLQLSTLLLSHPSLANSHYGGFAVACLRRHDCQPLLQQLLQTTAVRAAAAVVPVVQHLLAARLQFLRAHTATAPVFSWCMTEASLPSYPQVQTFLRGPQQEITVAEIFNSIHDARSFAEENFNCSHRCSAITYSARATPGGKGRKSYCTLAKTRELYDRQVQQHEAWLAELQSLAALYTPGQFSMAT